MDKHTLIVELVKAHVEMVKAMFDFLKGLAWPAVVGAGAWYFKDKLATLLEEMTEWEGFGTKAKWGSRVKDAAQDVVVVAEEQHAAERDLGPATSDLNFDDEPAERPAAPPRKEDHEMTDAEFINSAKVNKLLRVAAPDAAIVPARQNLERAVMRLLKQSNLDGITLHNPSGYGTPFTHALDVLLAKRVISMKIHTSALELWNLGNAAIHKTTRSSANQSADTYIGAVEALIAILVRQRKPA